MELKMAGTREENPWDPTLHYLPASCHSSFCAPGNVPLSSYLQSIQFLNYNWLAFKIFIALSSSYTITLRSCPPWDLHSPPTLAEHFQPWPLHILAPLPKIRIFSDLPLRPVSWLRFFFPLATLRLSSDFSWLTHSTPLICPRWASSSKKLLWANRGEGNLFQGFWSWGIKGAKSFFLVL